MAFFILFICISSLLFSSPSALPTLPETSDPSIESPPSPFPVPEQNSGLSGSPEPAPPVPPVTAPNQPIGQQPAAGDLQQDQQQQLDATVNGVSNQEQDQGQLQPSAGNVQPGAGALQPKAGGLQWQGQQALGFGAQPLIDNTPFDSGSSGMRRVVWFMHVLSLWFCLWSKRLTWCSCVMF
ncbi:uncharacterized protein A4U43_C08F4550 [Asparagus officinalis]|uniref:uncharacterized protein LOC109822478 n=1 Tax=Asparagus officinalis TaxID=4686 RepID=UPI00098E33D6|nr:uncharacterized protein LOC109822478 [Asparagus officinalis]ONK59253.1 uncharacterized protein A4U43_C08F4550 [Asparagus officinalis]